MTMIAKHPEQPEDKSLMMETKGETEVVVISALASSVHKYSGRYGAGPYYGIQ